MTGVVFDRLVAGLVFGCRYERLADASCSTTTLRRRDEWTTDGIFGALRRAVLAAYERLIGLDLADVAIDGCTTKAPCGGGVRRAQPGGPSRGRPERSQ